ncbi:hypothetical protein L0F63_005757 [Massospora cicadina]|nr:hypothetical protein L0F63_005757 [Massospora cicadina]
MNTQRQWIYDDTTDSLIEKDIQFFSNFFKIFDEFQVGVINLGIINMLTALSQAKDNMVTIKAYLRDPKLEDANKG